MALLPIDLQTLFTQANQVGKEQAVQKDAPPAAQSLQGAQLVQKTEKRDKAVNETHDQEEGPEQVKDRARRGAERRKAAEKGGSPPPRSPPRPTSCATPPSDGTSTSRADPCGTPFLITLVLDVGGLLLIYVLLRDRVRRATSGRPHRGNP